MIIRSYKNDSQPKLNYKVSNNDLFQLFETSDGRLLKKYKMASTYYQKLLLFHQDECYRDYLIELAKCYGTQEIINIPLELYETQGFVQLLIQRNPNIFMYLNNLALKTDLESFIAALNDFCISIKNMEGIDLSHIRVEDIIYDGSFQILNPEFILINNQKSQKNLAWINQTILKGLYRVGDLSLCDSRIEEEFQSAIHGEIGVDVLLNKIKRLEEKEYGKARYLKHINGNYIK